MTGTKRLVSFNLVFERYIHLYKTVSEVGAVAGDHCNPGHCHCVDGLLVRMPIRYAGNWGSIPFYPKYISNT